MNNIPERPKCAHTESPASGGSPASSEMPVIELRERLSDIHQRLERIEGDTSDKGHTFMIIIALIVLLLRGC